MCTARDANQIIRVVTTAVYGSSVYSLLLYKIIMVNTIQLCAFARHHAASLYTLSKPGGANKYNAHIVTSVIRHGCLSKDKSTVI
jgi:hypothetical protein